MERKAKILTPADHALIESQRQLKKAIHEGGVAIIRKGFEGIDNLAESGATALKRAIVETLTGKK